MIFLDRKRKNNFGENRKDKNFVLTNESRISLRLAVKRE